MCIFGGDHVYKMDVRQMLAFHQERERRRDRRGDPGSARARRATSASSRWTRAGASSAFHEKVENPPPMPGNDDMCLASMGNYIFKPDAAPARARGGRRRSRRAATTSATTSCRAWSKKGGAVFAYDFATNRVPGEDEHDRGYWRDIGTVDAYWEAQMDLIEIHPQFNLYNFRWPIRTGATHDPPAKFVFRDEAQARVGIATDSMVSHGCIISGGRIHRSVLGVGCRVNSFSEVEESVLFESVRVGRHAKIRRAHHRQGRRDPARAPIIGFDREADRQRFFVTDEGIVVIPKRAKLTGP